MYSKESSPKLAYSRIVGGLDDDHAANHEREVKECSAALPSGGHFLLEVPLAY